MNYNDLGIYYSMVPHVVESLKEAQATQLWTGSDTKLKIANNSFPGPSLDAAQLSVIFYGTAIPFISFVLFGQVVAE